jgi:hypothetical protein
MFVECFHQVFVIGSVEPDPSPFTALYTPSPARHERRSIHLDFTPSTPKRESVKPRRSFMPQSIPVPNRTFLIGLGVFLVVSALYKAIGMMVPRGTTHVPLQPPTESEPLLLTPPPSTAPVVSPDFHMPTQDPLVDLSQYVPLTEFEERQAELEVLTKTLSVTLQELRGKIDPSECRPDETKLRSCFSNLSALETSLSTCQDTNQQEKITALTVLENTERVFSDRIASIQEEKVSLVTDLKQRISHLQAEMDLAQAQIDEAQSSPNYFTWFVTTLALALSVIVMYLMATRSSSPLRISVNEPDDIKQLTQRHEQEMAQMRAILSEAATLNTQLSSIMKEVIHDSSIASTTHGSPSASPSSLSEKLEASALTPIRVEPIVDLSMQQLNHNPARFMIASPTSKRRDASAGSSLWDGL